MPHAARIKLCLLSLILLLSRISAQDNTPDDAYASGAPYAINQSDASANDVSANNRVATFLYGYNDCIKVFGDKAKDIINEAYLDAYYLSK